MRNNQLWNNIEILIQIGSVFLLDYIFGTEDNVKKILYTKFGHVKAKWGGPNGNHESSITHVTLIAF